jgi:hypothetical protein
MIRSVRSCFSARPHHWHSHVESGFSGRPLNAQKAITPQTTCVQSTGWSVCLTWLSSVYIQPPKAGWRAGWHMGGNLHAGKAVGIKPFLVQQAPNWVGHGLPARARRGCRARWRSFSSSFALWRCHPMDAHAAGAASSRSALVQSMFGSDLAVGGIAE